jgi:uncharacterized cofD-like protein
LPVTTDQATLVAELTDGTRIFGEQAIDMPRGHQREKIRDVFLVPHHCDAIQVYPPVVEAIATADYIIMGPGDLFTSIIPNLIVPGVAAAICNSHATLLFVMNIMTKYGETHNFQAVDFVTRLEGYIGKQIDGVIYSNKPPADAICRMYKAQKAECVLLDPDDPYWFRRIPLRRRLAGDRWERHPPPPPETGRIAAFDLFRRISKVLPIDRDISIAFR